MHPFYLPDLNQLMYQICKANSWDVLKVNIKYWNWVVDPADAAFMTDNGFQVTGIDGSEQMIHSAIKLHPELNGNLIAAAIPEDLYKIEQTFDGIYSIATLMHLKEAKIRLVLEGLSKLLNPGGKLFFSVSIARNDINELGFDKNGRFFLILSKEEWISICEDGGFKEVSVTRTKDGLHRDGMTWLTCIFEKG